MIEAFVCRACGDRHGRHVFASDGVTQLCPRVASGEGAYLNAGTMSYGVWCRDCNGPCDGHDFYRFVPVADLPAEALAELEKLIGKLPGKLPKGTP